SKLEILGSMAFDPESWDAVIHIAADSVRLAVGALRRSSSNPASMGLVPTLETDQSGWNCSLREGSWNFRLDVRFLGRKFQIF
ncbi:hypothetical protein, partial [Lacticaseibacillus rhamnosus]|uniref:hypothetical protein n=1 Tax=Lacticaseibacillus rhamnosus TaxID=47715 RepID=UPI003F45B09D